MVFVGRDLRRDLPLEYKPPTWTIETRWISTDWGGLGWLTGRWVKTHSAPQRWEHESRNLVIEEEKNHDTRTGWALRDCSTGNKLLESTSYMHTTMPRDSSWEWRVSRHCNALSPPDWDDIYSKPPSTMRAIPSAESYYMETVQLFVSKTEHRSLKHLEAQNRLDAALEHGSSLWFHGAIADERRDVLGEYKLRPNADNDGHPVYHKAKDPLSVLPALAALAAAPLWKQEPRAVDGLFFDGTGWTVKLGGKGILESSLKDSSLKDSLPSSDQGAWKVLSPVRVEKGAFRPEFIIAPFITCTANDDGCKAFEKCRCEVKELVERDERAVALRVPNYLRIRTTELRLGDHIFYPTLTVSGTL